MDSTQPAHPAPPSAVRPDPLAEKPVYERMYARYFSGGRVDVCYSPDGLPSFEAVCPAPFVSETERQRKVDAARRGIVLDGAVITSERRIRNDAFDKRGEKTTTKFCARICKNEDEARAAVDRIERLLAEMSKEPNAH
jgi:hypothetical protein